METEKALAKILQITTEKWEQWTKSST
jgi:hypothetical protein